MGVGLTPGNGFNMMVLTYILGKELFENLNCDKMCPKIPRITFELRIYDDADFKF